MKRWKVLVLALALTVGGAFGFFTAEVGAAPNCGQVCCPGGQCFDCFPARDGRGPCVCPLIFCA